MDQSLLLFDFDGVLADSREAMLGVIRRACRAVGHPEEVSPEDLRGLRRMEFEELARHLGIPEESTNTFAEAALREIGNINESPGLFDGIEALLSGAVALGPIGIITANRKSYVDQFLRTHGLDKCVSMIFDADQAGTKAEKIHMAMAQTGIPANHTWMIGDAVSDIEAAHKAGVRSVAVAWGFQDDTMLKEARPDHFVEHPDDLLAILNSEHAGQESTSV